MTDDRGRNGAPPAFKGGQGREPEELVDCASTLIVYVVLSATFILGVLAGVFLS